MQIASSSRHPSLILWARFSEACREFGNRDSLPGHFLADVRRGIADFHIEQTGLIDYFLRAKEITPAIKRPDNRQSQIGGNFDQEIAADNTWLKIQAREK